MKADHSGAKFKQQRQPVIIERRGKIGKFARRSVQAEGAVPGLQALARSLMHSSLGLWFGLTEEIEVEWPVADSAQCGSGGTQVLDCHFAASQ